MERSRSLESEGLFKARGAGASGAASSARVSDNEQTDLPRDGINLRLYWGLLGAVTLFLCLPILTVHYLSFTDYPGHLASIYVMFHYHDTPRYQQYFTFNWAPIPNLAFEIIGPPLLHFMGLFTAGRVFLILTLLLFVTGCHLLGKAIHGRETYLAIACTFFFYGLFLFGAEMNFLFGLALFAIALAFTLRWRERWNAKTLTLASVLYSCTYFAHLGGYAFLGFTVVTIAGFELLARRISLRRAALDIIPLVPPLILFVVFMNRGGTIGNSKHHIVWKSNLGIYITGAVSELVTYYHHWNRVWAASAALIVMVMVWQILRRKVGVSKPVMLAGIMLFAAFLVCPHELFTSVGADQRFVPAALLLIVLALEVRGKNRVCAALFGLWLVVSMTRVGFIWSAWRKFDPITATGIQMLATLPAGAKLYPFQPYPQNGATNLTGWAFGHASTYSIIYEKAYDPGLWVRRSAYPLAFRNDPHYYDDSPHPAAQRARQLVRYDYAWSTTVSPKDEQTLERECTPILKRDGFTLWKVNRSSEARQSSPLPEGVDGRN
ncbi:MAG: hypothetical protein ACRD2P_17035 [Terriglobia bacterium]